MVVDVNGQIAYGIVCPEGAELPWDEQEYDFDIDNWWSGQTGKDHPCPVSLLRYCSSEYPMWALIVPGSLIMAWIGSPTEFQPSALVVTDEQAEALRNFVIKYGIKTEGDLGWFLSSDWG